MARPQYKAEKGKEDRHGEMTGAIQVNMVMTAIPAILWCIYIGPWLLPDQFWTVVGIGVAMAVILPIALLKVSQIIWAYLSHWLNQEDHWW